MVDDVHAGSWLAMGCTVDVVIVGGHPGLLDSARSSIDHLERCWSRFLPDSDISRLNHAEGSPVQVEPSTVILLRAMVDGWRATEGAFDPTLLAPLVGLGYEASWHDPSVVTSLPHAAMSRSDLDQLSIDDEISVVTIPGGSCLDAGGIGKGLAADMVVAELLATGVRGASVSIGGDVAVAGAAPQPGSWLIGVADPTDLDVEASQLALVWGGVATSGTLRRRWRDRDGAMVHHLLDPATRRPAHHHREIVAATVIAGTAAWAEVWTKAVMVRGVMMLPVLDRFALGAQVTYADTATTVNTTWSNFAVSGQRGDPVGDVTGMVEA